MQMKGPANAVDMQKQLYEMEQLRGDVSTLSKQVMAYLKQICSDTHQLQEEICPVEADEIESPRPVEADETESPRSI
jgi:hypothetical protein